MTRSRRSTRPALLLLATAGLALSACGGGGSDNAAPTTTGAAAGAATTTVPSAAQVTAVPATWKLAAPVAREVVVSDDKQFTIVGGLDATKFSTAAVVTVDPTDGSSRPAGTLLAAVHDAAGARIGTRTLVFGGGGSTENGSTDVQAVPPTGATTVVGKLPRGRSDHVAAAVGGKVYVLGGYDGANIVPDVLSTTDGSSFTKVSVLPVPVRYPAVAVVGKAVYLFGGVVNSEAGLDTTAVQRLDTATGAVTTVAHLPASLSHASAVVLGGQVYLLGGYVDNTKLSNQILQFDPATGAAIAVGTLPVPLSDAAAVVIGGRGYVVGGQSTDRAPVATVVIVSVG